jgi:predicted dehydrogenase
MTTAAKLGAAVVGLGVGEQHARTLVGLPDCELRWLYDLDENRAQLLAQELTVANVANSYEEVLADSEVGLVSIASFDDAHFAQVLGALNADKNVFVEKPLCHGLEELKQIKQAWRESGKHLSSNLVLRAAPLYAWLREAIASGELGEVYAFDGDYLYGRVHKITEGWRNNVDDYSVMEGGGVHLVDLLMWLTGQRPTTVMAAGNRIATADTSFRYNDFVAATFQFDSGLVGRIAANFGSVHPHHHVVRVFGTKGTFIYDDAGARIHVSRDPESVSHKLTFSPLPASKGDLIPEFVNAVVTGSAELTDTQAHLDVISACASADRAVATRTMAEVEYV